MPPRHDDPNQAGHVSNLRGIHLNLLLVADGLTAQGLPGAQAVTYLAERLHETIEAMERWQLPTGRTGILAWTLFAVYSCAADWPIDWSSLPPTALDSALWDE